MVYHQADCRCHKLNSIKQCLRWFDVFTYQYDIIEKYKSVIHSGGILPFCRRRIWNPSSSSVSPSRDRIFAFVSVCNTFTALTKLSGIPYDRGILISLPQWMVSNDFLILIKIMIMMGFISLMPSIKRLKA